MTRHASFFLAGALAGLLATLTIQAQEPAGRQGGQGRGRGQAVALPEGEGKALVEGACASCHPLNMVTGTSGFTRQGWRDLVATTNQRPDALVRFDPKTEKFQSWAIPSGVGIIRHMRVSPDKKLVIHQSSTNRIGLVTIGKAAR